MAPHLTRNLLLSLSSSFLHSRPRGQGQRQDDKMDGFEREHISMVTNLKELCICKRVAYICWNNWLKWLSPGESDLLPKLLSVYIRCHAVQKEHTLRCSSHMLSVSGEHNVLLSELGVSIGGFKQERRCRRPRRPLEQASADHARGSRGYVWSVALSSMYKDTDSADAAVRTVYTTEVAWGFEGFATWKRLNKIDGRV